MRRWICTAAALILFASPVTAQTEQALNVIPDNALGFILITDLSQFSKHVQDLADRLKVPERVSLLELIEKKMGLHEGLRPNGSAAFVVLKSEKQKEAWDFDPVMVIPVADHQKMFAQLGVKNPTDGINKGEAGTVGGLLAGIGGGGENPMVKTPVLAAKKGEFMLLAYPEQREALERVLRSQKGIAAAVKPARKWLDAQDISGVVTEPGVKFGLGMGLGLLASGSPEQEAQLKATFKDIEKNVKLITFGGYIGDEGHPRLRTRIYFDPEGDYAKKLAKIEAIEGTQLQQFASQDYVIAAMARLSPQLNFEAVFKGLRSFLGVQMPGEKANKLLQRISEVTAVAYEDRSNEKGTPLANPPAGLMAQVDDAPKFVEAAIDLIQDAQKATDAGDVKIEQKQLAGKPARLVTFGRPKRQEKADGANGPSAPGALVLVELDSRTVLACTVSKPEEAESILRKFTQKPAEPLSQNAGIKQTMALQPGKLQVVAYLAVEPLSGLLGGGISLTGRKHPPIAFSLRAMPAAVEAEFLIPFGAMQAVFDARKEGEKKK